MENEKKYFKIGIIGLGRMGLMHAAIFNSLPNSKVVAVADPSNFPAKQLSELNPDIKHYKSAEDLFNFEKIDAAVIASPVGFHVENALLCVENNIPFLMEKPLAISTSQALPLLEKLNAKKIPNMIGFMARNIDSFFKGKEVLISDCLGKIIYVKGSVYVSQLFQKGKGWRYDPKVSGGGVLLSQGSHIIDLLTWYFGRISRVNADVLSVYSPGIEDFAHVILQFDSGLKGWIDVSWSVRFKRKMEIHIDILGDNGSLIITDDTLNLFLDKPCGYWSAGKTFLTSNDLYTGVFVDIGGPKFTLQAQKFLNALEKNILINPDIQQGFHVQQVVEAAYNSSLKNGEGINID